MEGCDILESVAERIFPGCETVSVPVANGGEGTMDALLRAMGGKCMVAQVNGPLFEPVNTEWGLLSDGVTAVTEMAQSSGLPFIPEGKRNPRNTTSLGTGEMMAEALRRRAKKLLIATGEKTIEEVGTELFNLIVEVAGRSQAAVGEKHGLHNFLCIFNPAPIT